MTSKTVKLKREKSEFSKKKSVIGAKQRLNQDDTVKNLIK